MELTPAQYMMGSVEILKIDTNRYRGVITSEQSGCTRTFEYDNEGGPGKS